MRRIISSVDPLPHVTQDAPGHFRKEHLHHVQPGGVLGSKHKLEPARMGRKPSASFLGRVCGMIVAKHPDAPVHRIGFMELFQKLDELSAPMPVPNNPMDLSRDQIQSHKERQGSQPHILMVAAPCFYLP